MKNRKLKILLTSIFALSGLVGCGETPQEDPSSSQATSQQQSEQSESSVNVSSVVSSEFEEIDYAGSINFDMNTTTAKMKVTVKQFIDGDTTHFHVPVSDEFDEGVFKARYIAVDTPESTGHIEPYGKTASNFTKSKLSEAVEIYVESDTADGKWNADSSRSRIMSWIWYRTSTSEKFRNLNIEILQNGLCRASNTQNNRYGATAWAAYNQAKAMKLSVHSGERDPNFYYGTSIAVSMAELRQNVEAYVGKMIAVEGVISGMGGNAVYIQDMDDATGIMHAMYVYYGFNASADVLALLQPGNRIYVVGSLQYYEAGGTYQIADPQYDIWGEKESCKLISKNNEIVFTEVDIPTFLSDVKVERTIVKEDESEEIIEKTYKYAELAMDSAICMKDLKVTSIYTTASGNSKGAMTMTCKDANNNTITVRTEVLRDESGAIITEDAYLNKTIDVKGFVDYFNGGYQIGVPSASYISVK